MVRVSLGRLKQVSKLWVKIMSKFSLPQARDNHSSDLPSTLDSPWVELHSVQYQSHIPTNQGIACFKNSWPTFVSSGAKKYSAAPSPWHHNCAWEGFSYLQVLRVVWAHSMQRMSFTTDSWNIFTWNIIFDLYTRMCEAQSSLSLYIHCYCYLFIGSLLTGSITVTEHLHVETGISTNQS